MQHDLAETRRILETQNIDVLRLIFTDLLGITRSKDILVSQLERAAAHGPAFCQGTWVTTTRGGVLDAGSGSFGDGLPDMISRLDTDTIRPIPWLPGVAYAIADIDNPDGTRSEVAPRAVLRSVLDEYDKLGLTPVCGPELEFYFAQRTEDGWERILNKTGRVYTTGAHVDPDGHYLYLLRMLDQLNIGAFAGNHEFCPSQYEINLWHSEAMDAADRTFLFKTAIKDVTATRGILGTFLGKPWNDEGGSGFHLHFSVTDADGTNLMHDGGDGLSQTALQMIAGVTEHADAIAAFTNPTVNAYKRIPPERGQGTRLELRIGDGAASPYVVIAVVLAAALDGIRRGLTAPPPAEGWAYEDEARPVLPMSLRAALDALDADAGLRDLLTGDFIDVFMTMKRDEVERYEAEVEDPDTRDVTRWELDEYIEDY